MYTISHGKPHSTIPLHPPLSPIITHHSDPQTLTIGSPQHTRFGLFCNDNIGCEELIGRHRQHLVTLSCTTQWHDTRFPHFPWQVAPRQNHFMTRGQWPCKVIVNSTPMVSDVQPGNTKWNL
jgi:hypothetical protein